MKRVQDSALTIGKGGEIMATKSISKKVCIKNEQNVRDLVRALYRSRRKSEELPEINVTSHDLRGEELIKAFKVKLNGAQRTHTKSEMVPDTLDEST